MLTLILSTQHKNQIHNSVTNYHSNTHNNSAQIQKVTMTLHVLICMHSDRLLVSTRILCSIMRTVNQRPARIAPKRTHMIYGVTGWGRPSISIYEFATLLAMHIVVHSISFYFL